jgi:hypothetical protein
LTCKIPASSFPVFSFTIFNAWALCMGGRRGSEGVTFALEERFSWGEIREREGGRVGGRKEGRVGGRKGGREGGREGGRGGGGKGGRRRTGGKMPMETVDKGRATEIQVGELPRSKEGREGSGLGLG